MSNFQRLVKYVIWVKIGPIHLQGIKIYPCQLDIIGAVSSEEKKLGQNSKIEIDNSNNNHTTTGSLSSSLHDAEELLGGFQLLDLIIPELKSHVIPYKFKCSHWWKIHL